MKKIGLLSLLLLGACSFYGDMSWWTFGSFGGYAATYSIDYIDNDEKKVSEEYVSEVSVKKDEILEAYVGHSVVSEKIYKITNYETNTVKANVDGYMSSASAPCKISAGVPLKVIGTVEIDDVEYRIIPSDLTNFVYLIREDGSFWDEMGQIKNGRLSILDAAFVPTPDNLRMEPVKQIRSEHTKPVKGYDIKFQGVNFDRMMFTYFDYSKYQNTDAGEFEDISFPLKRGPIEINGVKIKVINVDRFKLEYMLLED